MSLLVVNFGFYQHFNFQLSTTKSTFFLLFVTLLGIKVQIQVTSKKAVNRPT